MREVHTRSSFERSNRESRETRTVASPASRFQSPFGLKKRETTRSSIRPEVPIVQFDPTRTQSDDRSPNGWMNGGKGFKVLTLVVKRVLCFRSCFLCAIDVPRRILFWTTKGINASTAGSRLSTPSLPLVGFIPLCLVRGLLFVVIEEELSKICTAPFLTPSPFCFHYQRSFRWSSLSWKMVLGKNTIYS